MAIVRPARRSGLVERLDEHQARIRAMLAQAAAVLAAPEPDPFEMAQVRWRTLRDLREYQLFKHHHLFDPRIRAGGADAARVDAMKDRCVALGEQVVTHVLKWSGQAVAAQWDAFAQEAAALLRTLDAGMQVERADCLRLDL